MSSGPSLSFLQHSLRASSRLSAQLSTSQSKLPSLSYSPQPLSAPALRLTNVSRHFSSSRSVMAPTNSPASHYQYAVLGGGSGGSGAARRASGWYGAKTAIIDNGLSGGCCVNVGCVPKKMTLNYASINEAIETGKHYGYDIKDVSQDFASFVEKRHARIKVLNGAYESNWEKEGIDLIKGTATFISAESGKIELEIKPKDGGKPYRITADKVCIATGSHPTKPSGIKGSEYGITSDDFFSMKHLPKKYVFVGGGYIAVELAGVMNAIGVETHLFIRHNTFLRKFDTMVQDTMTQHYEDIGIHVHREHPGIKEVVQLNPGKDETDPREKKLKLIMNDGTEMETNELLWAIGRAAETEDLALDKIGMKLNDTGHIIVDKYQNTSIDGIYAIGDVTGQAELTPVAIAAGRKLGNRLFGPPEHKNDYLDYDRIPSVIFSHPEIGSIGLSESEAEKRYGKENLKVYQTKFSAMFYDVFSPEEKKKNPTQFKVICHGPREEIVGLHILGKGCDEMMQGFGVVVRMKGTKADLDNCVPIHPTSAEELVTLR